MPWREGQRQHAARQPDATEPVKITRKHQTPTRVGGVLGGGVGLATGLVVALFPFAAIGVGCWRPPQGCGLECDCLLTYNNASEQHLRPVARPRRSCRLGCTAVLERITVRIRAVPASAMLKYSCALS
jgi:hypothetical protein